MFCDPVFLSIIFLVTNTSWLEVGSKTKSNVQVNGWAEVGQDLNILFFKFLIFINRCTHVNNVIKRISIQRQRPS